MTQNPVQLAPALSYQCADDGCGVGQVDSKFFGSLLSTSKILGVVGWKITSPRNLAVLCTVSGEIFVNVF